MSLAESELAPQIWAQFGGYESLLIADTMIDQVDFCFVPNAEIGNLPGGLVFENG